MTSASPNTFATDAAVVHTDIKPATETSASADLTATNSSDLTTSGETKTTATDATDATDAAIADSSTDAAPGCIPSDEICNAVDDDCDGKTDEDFEDLVCGKGACVATIAACIDGIAQVCEPLQPQKEACNNLDDDCDGQTDNGIAPVSCGIGACAATTSACVNGKPQSCSPKATGKEVCNNLDDDCDGKTDEGSALCPKAGESCLAGACKPGCQLLGATPCPADKLCSVGDDTVGQCLPAGSPCLVSTTPSPCGANSCGPGTVCHPQLQQCLPDAPCNGVACAGGACYGTGCPCTRPAALCQPAPLAAMNASSFSYGVVDIDMDLQCGLWGVTVLNGTDYLRHLTPDGKVVSVGSVGNLDMNEVAVLQGFASVFGGNMVEAALTYGCCNGCGCNANPPKGVAWYDKANNALPMMLPTNAGLAGTGPFLEPAVAQYLNSGATGLTWGLSNQLYVGNVVENGDFHVVDLASGKSALVTKLAARVYAATPFDGTRLVVALAGKQVVQLYLLDGKATPWANAPAEVIALQRDPFTGTTLLSLNDKQIRGFSSKGADMGLFATAPVPGRVTIGPDGWLYHVTPKVNAPAIVVRWQLPEKL